MMEQNYKLKTPHHGRAIRRIRKDLGIRQETLATEMNTSQQTISDYERRAIIKDEMLEKFAEALNVPVETIKEFEEGPVSVIIENNTFENNGNNIAYVENDNSTNSYNPLNEILELSKEKQELHERIIELEQEKSELLEKILLEKK